MPNCTGLIKCFTGENVYTGKVIKQSKSVEQHHDKYL